MDNDIPMNLERWKKLMGVFGFTENQDTFHELEKQYREKHRAYHNIDHIAACLDQLDAIPTAVPLKKEIELAIWFHDCIYNPYGKENELKSAKKAELFLQRQKADAGTISLIFDLIMATLHTQLPKNEAEALLQDIDLSILGAKPEHYNIYSEKVRREYKRVPRILYRKKRKEILSHFLQKNHIYHTPLFHGKFEEIARKNLKKEIIALS